MGSVIVTIIQAHLQLFPSMDDQYLAGHPLLLKSGAISYRPAFVETYIIDHLSAWGWDKASRNVPGCNIWTDPAATTDNVHSLLNLFRTELKNYYKRIEDFSPVSDVLKTIRDGNSHDVCHSLKLDPDGGIDKLFPSGQLSHTSTSGFIEPLSTPMRHPDFCFDTKDRDALMDLNYLVHDFEAMCNSLKPTSRRILIDLGASLSYHEENEQVKSETPPMVSLLNLYHKFGFVFDHIYAYEVTFIEPEKVFNNLLPKEYMTSYHWINAGVNPTKGHRLNPLDSILRNFEEDDFIVIKVDIDKHSIEWPLVNQLLEDTSLHKLVDQLYFEHHVMFKEMSPIWRSAMKGSLKDTFDLFHSLRTKGIPAHFWP